MIRTEYDKTVAAMRVTAELVSKELEGTVKSKSDLRRYLFMLEYNNINYRIKDYYLNEFIYVITDYAIASFDYEGNQLYIRRK